jgi:hypothetical protein
MGIPLNGTAKQTISDGLEQRTKRNNRTVIIANYNRNNTNNNQFT